MCLPYLESRPFTRDEFQVLGVAGFFRADPVELVGGEVLLRGQGKPRLWTREEYYRMAELGILREFEHIELIQGHVVLMSPRDAKHDDAIQNTTMLLVPALGDTHYVRVQSAFIASEKSEPEPDFSIVLRHDKTAGQHPERADLAIEVSNTSLRGDRYVKGPMYSARILEYWIINVVARRLEVYREPGADGYANMQVLNEGDTVSPLCRPDLTFRVGDLF